ncbi:DUF3008 family protein [Rhodosalinus sp.]|uniref:DUF3008 family protein n=1 Tax=Rhodosalinus sp. TaxID=2047741 RepID=UPI0039796DCF
MPARPKTRQQAAGHVLATTRGETDPDDPQDSAKSVHDSMSASQLGDFAERSRKGKPEHDSD